MTAAAGWRELAPALAERDMAECVNRPDVWGQYRPVHKRELRPDGTENKHWTLPARDRRGVEFLTAETITRHYRGADVGHVVGLHAIGVDGSCRWIGFDFDNHESAAEQAARNLASASATARWLAAFGLASLIEDSDGGGGLHLWTLFDRPAPAPAVYAFAQAVLSETSAHAETYPKQAHVPAGKYGSWLRRPGRHHTRPHWSRFLDGDTWRDGADAARLWLEAPRCDPTALVKVAATLPAPASVDDAPPAGRVLAWQAPAQSGDVDRRVQGYMRRLPTGLGAGEGRNHAGYRFACWLVRDMALDDADALRWLAEWNGWQRTPMPDGKLAALVSDAHAYGSRSVGSAA